MCMHCSFHNDFLSWTSAMMVNKLHDLFNFWVIRPFRIKKKKRKSPWWCCKNDCAALKLHSCGDTCQICASNFYVFVCVLYSFTKLPIPEHSENKKKQFIKQIGCIPFYSLPETGFDYLFFSILFFLYFYFRSVVNIVNVWFLQIWLCCNMCRVFSFSCTLP